MLRGFSLALLLTSWVAASPLHQGAERGDLSQVKASIERQKLPINAPDKTGSTALLLSISHRQLGVAKYLLSRGADPNLANSEGETPLSLAVYQGELELVQLLFKSGAKLKSKTQPPRNLLGAAAISPYGAKVVPVLKLLIQKGCNPRELQDGYNLFHQVCLSCKLPQMKYLVLTEKFDVNQPTQDKIKNSPLHLAYTVEAASWLLDHGADPNATNADGESPLYNFMMTAELARLLVTRGSRINLLNQQNLSPLAAAAGAQNLEVVSELLKLGADVHLGEEQGRSALAESISSNADSFSLFQKLIAAGADPKIIDPSGSNLLHKAAVSNNQAIADYLVSRAGLDVNQLNQQGQTPLHSAFLNAEMTQWLLSKGAQVNAVDRLKNTALHYATYFAKADCVKALLAAGADRSLKNIDGETALSIAQKVLDKLPKEEPPSPELTQAATIVKLLTTP